MTRQSLVLFGISALSIASSAWAIPPRFDVLVDDLASGNPGFREVLSAAPGGIGANNPVGYDAVRIEPVSMREVPEVCRTLSKSGAAVAVRKYKNGKVFESRYFITGGAAQSTLCEE